MIEPEMAFADLDDDMFVAEAMLKYVINYVLENAPEEMNFFNSFFVSTSLIVILAISLHFRPANILLFTFIHILIYELNALL